MKRILVVGLLALCVLNAQAQESDSTNRRGIPKLAIKWSPLHLINTFPTVQIDAEAKIAEHWSFQAGGSPVIYFDDDRQNSTSFNRRGFKLKSEVRYYLTKQLNTKATIFYTGLGFDYNNLLYNSIRNYYFECGPDCYYRERRSIENKKKIYSLTHRLGLQTYMTDWLLFDVNLGWGARWGYYEGDAPIGASWSEDSDVWFSDFDSDFVETRPAIGIGVKFSVRIK